MHLVDRHRRGHRVDGLPVGQPAGVAPGVRRVVHHAGRGRRHLGGERERVGAEAEMALLGEHLVLVVRAGGHAGQEDLPDPRSAQRPHRVHPAVPAVEVADHPYRSRVRRPDRERRAGDRLVHADMRAEVPPEALVPALAQQVQIQLAHRRPEAVRIVDRHHVLARIGDFQPVVGDPGAGHHPAEDAGRVQRPHRYPLAVAEDDRHVDRVRPPAPDHHHVLPVGVARRVRAEHAVRVVVLPGHDPVQLGAGRPHQFARPIQQTAHADPPDRR